MEAEAEAVEAALKSTASASLELSRGKFEIQKRKQLYQERLEIGD